MSAVGSIRADDRDTSRRQPPRVARGGHRARRRRRHRPGSREGRSRRPRRRRDPRPRQAAGRGRRDPDRHAQERRRLPLRDAPLGRARDGRGRPERRPRAPSSGSGRRSRTASTTTSTCRGPSPRTTSRRSRPRSRASSRPRRPFQRSVMTIPDAHDVLRRARRHLQGRPGGAARLPEARPPSRSTATRDFVDLCRGPHLHDTGRIGQGQAALRRRRLLARQREEPAAHPHLRHRLPQPDGARRVPRALEQARARDHRRVGRDLGLFYFDEHGPGFPFFLPKGMVIVNGDQGRPCARSCARMDYDEIQTPTMLSDELLEGQRPLGQLPREHVLLRGRRGRTSRSSR